MERRTPDGASRKTRPSWVPHEVCLPGPSPHRRNQGPVATGQRRSAARAAGGTTSSSSVSTCTTPWRRRHGPRPSLPRPGWSMSSKVWFPRLERVRRAGFTRSRWMRSILEDPGQAVEYMEQAVDLAAQWGAEDRRPRLHDRHRRRPGRTPRPPGPPESHHRKQSHRLCGTADADHCLPRNGYRPQRETVAVVGIPGSIAVAAGTLAGAPLPKAPAGRAAELASRQSTGKRTRRGVSARYPDRARPRRVVLSATSTGNCIDPARLQPGSIVVDVAVPTDIQGTQSPRDDVLLLSGGLAACPTPCRARRCFSASTRAWSPAASAKPWCSPWRIARSPCRSAATFASPTFRRSATSRGSMASTSRSCSPSARSSATPPWPDFRKPRRGGGRPPRSRRAHGHHNGNGNGNGAGKPRPAPSSAVSVRALADRAAQFHERLHQSRPHGIGAQERLRQDFCARRGQRALGRRRQALSRFRRRLRLDEPRPQPPARRGRGPRGARRAGAGVRAVRRQSPGGKARRAAGGADAGRVWKWSFSPAAAPRPSRPP